ncbi:LRR receptor-like serine/threonine-protein kinase GSO1 [Senna tora]|uniref:LRR receptor-like serine/threonine-protein kinase GSO1 n=1 Tax=Senna tora TaxID=362788 RepID=A0A834SLX8_9FABA|nr:LRR receptor-like serine/threonine-protein kinase GSO1 [Senna tora]
MDEMENKRSPYAARSPEEAHVFMIPISIAYIVHFLYNPLVTYDRDQLMRIVVDYTNIISHRYPYWNASRGADHFLLSCHDWAPDISKEKAGREVYKNLIRVLCNANTSEGFDPKKDVSLPEINIRGKLSSPTPSQHPLNRSILAFFAGGSHGAIRKSLLRHWKDKDKDIQVHEYLPKGMDYQALMGRAKFCLCPSGYEVASPRVVEAINAGCVPVIVSDHYTVPFSDVLDWSKFSLYIPSERMGEIKSVLEGVSMRKYLKLQKRVVKVQRHFELNRIGNNGIMGCLEEERVSLLKFKDSLKNNSLLPSWNEQKQGDCCAWDGVICDNATRRVTKLILRRKPLNDDMLNDPLLGIGMRMKMNASHLLPLNQLQVLDLSFNSFTGVVCKLKNLQVLDLSYNRFSGYLPACLGNLTSLQALDVSYNRFKGTISSTLITSLTNLQYISLSKNYFEGLFSLSWLANHTKLEALDLICDSNSNLRIESDDSSFFPQSQLKYLALSCGPLGVIPKFLSHQYALEFVDLLDNKMGGMFPLSLLKNNKRLLHLNLGGNNLTGVLELDSSLYSPHMIFFDVSDNGFQGGIPSAIGSIFPNMSKLNMSKNAFQGQIPSSMGNMRDLRALHLSNNNLSGQIPDELLANCKLLYVLDLANNGLHGQILPTNSNLTSLMFLYLYNNHFKGEISKGLLNSPSLYVLFASNNSLFGNLPSWMGNLTELRYLDLSRNQLGGPIPLSTLQYLVMLDLSLNNFSDIVPHCNNNTPTWSFLHLKGNKLSGPIPNVLSNASFLILLDLMNNELSSEIPIWINALSNLRFLILAGNKLEGPIPPTLCQLQKLTLLDLAHNNFSGGVPSCFNNMAPESIDETFTMDVSFYAVTLLDSLMENLDTPFHPQFFYGLSETMSYMVQVQFRTKFRSELYKGKILFLMSGIDLSCNNLTGKIPSEIRYLGNIHSLNLSHNVLSGTIPESLSQLREIESLDLSHNRLSGNIPWEMKELYRLSTFSVAYNNLSGSTPLMVNQFATFEKRSYEGNPFLCGPPLDLRCFVPPPPAPAGSDSSSLIEDDGFKEAFLWSSIGSFVIAFLGVIAYLYLTYYFSPYNKRLWFWIRW